MKLECYSYETETVMKVLARNGKKPTLSKEKKKYTDSMGDSYTSNCYFITVE